jgi:hypothetical protein
MILILYLSVLILADTSTTYKSKYTETPSGTIKYDPHGENPLVGIKGTHIDTDGLVLRRSKDQGGIVLFLEDNKYSEWSFTYTVTDIDLHFPEEGGIYLWYTTYDQDMGNYRGGKGIFDGLMAGIEFKGLSPELVFAFNDGSDYENDINDTLYKDSFNPSRLKGVKDLTIKVIVTKKNFKIELYDKDKLLYDSMRLITGQPHKLLGTDKRFSITTYYKNTSSEKSFKLINAQLYKREEHEGYDAESIHAENIGSLPMYADDVMHPDKELRHFIAQFSHFTDYMKSVLGDTDNPSIRHYSTKILEKLNLILKDNKEVKVDNINQHINDRVNDMDIRLQNIQKNILDILHTIGDMNLKKNQKFNLLSYILLGFGCGIFILLSVREYDRYFYHPKKL